MNFEVHMGDITYDCDYDERYDYLYMTVDGFPSYCEAPFEIVNLFKKITGIDIEGFKQNIDKLEKEDIEILSDGYISREAFNKIKEKIFVREDENEI